MLNGLVFDVTCHEFVSLYDLNREKLTVDDSINTVCLQFGMMRHFKFQFIQNKGGDNGYINDHTGMGVWFGGSTGHICE